MFDEIHAYDDRLFGALLRFLRDISGVPSLLVTASLPEARRQALLKVVGRLDPIPGPAEMEERPRYCKAVAPGNDPVPLVLATLDAGGKVLWVCNTVGRVMRAAARVANHAPLLYHSRFKYEDRVVRHKAVIEAFTSGRPGPALAICSQVAEMSLDLKGCTLLVTDLAPVPAVIQRLGRLNRQASDGDPSRPFVVLEPDSPLPYTTADLEAARTWYGRLKEDGISQRQLADAWEQSTDQPPVQIGCAWLDGGPETTVKELREGSPGVTVVTHDDLPRVRATPEDLLRVMIPMPPRDGWETWPQERGIPVAPQGTIDYDSLRGAAWVN